MEPGEHTSKTITPSVQVEGPQATSLAAMGLTLHTPQKVRNHAGVTSSKHGSGPRPYNFKRANHAGPESGQSKDRTTSFPDAPYRDGVIKPAGDLCQRLGPAGTPGTQGMVDIVTYVTGPMGQSRVDSRTRSTPQRTKRPLRDDRVPLDQRPSTTEAARRPSASTKSDRDGHHQEAGH